MIRFSVWHCLFAALAALLAALPAEAVRPSEWAHQTEADFQTASLDQTVVTDLGKIELSREAEKLAAAEGKATLIYDALVGPDDRLIMAMGPEGMLGVLNEENESIDVAASFDGEQVFTLARRGDETWVAVSGENSRLEARDAELKVTRTIELPEVRYVWDVLVDGPRLWVATGTEGRLLMIDLRDAEPTPVVALETEQKNLLCLGMDGKGRVYAGTDTEGLVYRVERQPYNDDEPFSMFVLYDAAEPEIGALLVTEDGTVYAGTADAQQARPGRMKEAVAEEKGEPEAPTEGEGGEPGDVPRPPKPDPKANDAEPAPEDQAPDAADEPEGGAGGTVEEAGEPAAQAEPNQPAEPAAPPKPTEEQYNKLREVVRDRLEKIREGKQVRIGRNSGGGDLSPRRPSGGSSPSAQQQQKGGNAVYRIQPDGFVQDVFRESVMVLKIVQQQGDLLIATGNEGQVYRLDPETLETTVIADLEPKQVPTMRLVDGEVLAGTANPAVLVRIGDEYAEEGTFTHDPMDAGQPSLWGQLAVLAAVPEGGNVTVQTRSGNLADPDSGGWSEWSDADRVSPQAEGQPVYVEVRSPTARFLQYRLNLTSDGTDTPSITSVAIKYLVPNMKPTIASIKATYPEGGGNGEGPTARTTVNVEWEATDANNDTLTYTLEARRLGTDQPFVEIDDEIEGTSYEWDTRTMPEGRYELRLTASDAPDNVAGQVRTARRVSAPVVVDNSAPAIEDLKVGRGEKAGDVTVAADVSDELSPIVEVRYKLNSEDEWAAVLPADRIYDSTNESVAFTITGLSPGRHVVSVRAVDALGNARYAAETVVVPKP